jgi:membrane-associated phospholipid phosphatase
MVDASTSQSEQDSHRVRAAAFAGLALGASAAFFVLARAVALRDTASVDRKVQRKVKVRSGKPARKAAEAVSPVGKWWTYVPASGVIAGYIIAARRPEGRKLQRSVAGGAAIVGTAVVAAILNNVLDDLVPQPPAPPGRPSPRHPVFPSGHTFGTASVGLASAWILSSERLVSPQIAFPVAMLFPLLSASARMMEEKHWLSDVAGGLLVAVAVASTSITVYEVVVSESFGSAD